MQTSDDVRDCWHDDITHIVNARAPARLDRKNTNRRKYEKFRDRMPHAQDALLGKFLKTAMADFLVDARLRLYGLR